MKASRRVRLLGIAAAALAIILSFYFASTRKGGDAPRDSATTFPLPRPAHATLVSRSDFVGAQACAGCHQSQFGAWSKSTHGHAGGPPSGQQIIAPFDGKTFRFSDAEFTPGRNAKGEYTFTVRQKGVDPIVFRVDGVVGKGHMVGGGSQAFFSRFPDGTLRLLPFDWMRKEAVWFCNTNSIKSGAWTPITTSISITECLNWTPRRALGDQFRLTTCSGCHGSQIELAFDSAQRKYDTKYTSLTINCESCHGPGRVHIERVSGGAVATSVDIGMQPLGTLGRDAAMAVCLQCHSLRNLLEPGYLPGQRFEEHYSLKFALLSNKAFYPDGRTRRFAYQEGQLSSECTRNGSLTCVDCHDPHSQTYRDVDGTRLKGRLDNGQCVACHASKAESLERHTKHAASSAGSKCVSCHMPYLQEPMLGDALHFARSDHTIPVPRPAKDSRMGIQTACAQCHANMPVAEQEATVTRWYGKLKPQSTYIARLDSVLGASDPTAIADRALMPEGSHPMAQFAGLTLFFESRAALDMPSMDAVVYEKLKTLTRNPDVDVRALALATLHFARSNDPATRSFLAQELAKLGADDAVIRKRWAMALGFRGDLFGRMGMHQQALATYRKALEIQPDNTGVILQVAFASMNLGDFETALTQIERVVALNPREPLAYAITGMILERQGDFQRAATAYERVLQLNPHDASAALSLGNTHMQRRDPASAAIAYERAVANDPGNAAADFLLARSYVLTGRDSSALRAVRKGLALAPNDSGGRQLLAYLQGRR